MGFKHLKDQAHQEKLESGQKHPRKNSSFEYQPLKKVKKGHFLENLKSTKNAPNFFFNLLVFECNRFIELFCCKKKNLFLIFCPLEFFENRTFN